MIHLEKVDENNFEAVAALKLLEKDERLVASPLYSLAQAWLYRETEDIRPYAIMNSQKVVGFALLVFNKAEREIYLWRLMIDREYQNKGNGKAALQELIRLAEEEPDIDCVRSHHVIGNHRMNGLLKQLGFVSKGLDGKEIKMIRKLKKEKK